MLRVSAVLVLSITLFACSSSVGSGEPPAAAPAAPAGPAIARVVSRDRSITLFAGGGKVRATVIDANGRQIAHDVDVDALQTIDASAYEACHASFATGERPAEYPEPVRR
jgi:hypothetical protein